MATDKTIKRFQHKVQVKDSSVWIRTARQHINSLTDQMRSQGYVPVLDLNPHASVDYTGKVFNYVITIHGIYIGRKRAWEIEGLAGDKLIPMNKSEQSSKK
jgi:hypothetical protein